MAVFPLVHVPPEGVLERVVVLPTHVLAAPDIVAGSGFTVAVTERKHPVGSTYETIDVPAATPLIIPLVLPMSATDVVPLIQVPPIVTFERVVVDPSHITGTPEIDAGTEFTVTTDVVKQPVGNM